MKPSIRSPRVASPHRSRSRDLLVPLLASPLYALRMVLALALQAHSELTLSSDGWAVEVEDVNGDRDEGGKHAEDGRGQLERVLGELLVDCSWTTVSPGSGTGKEERGQLCRN